MSHVGMSYRGFPLVQSLNIFVLVKWESPEKTPLHLEQAGTMYSMDVEYIIMPKEPIATQLQWS